MGIEKKYTKRELEIIRWRAEKRTQAYMAEKLGVTRQRIQQIEKKLDLDPRRKPGDYKTYLFTCKTCGKQGSSKVKGRVFCSRKCFYASRKVALTETDREERARARKERNRLRAKYYYHFVFKEKRNWRDIVKKRNDESQSRRGSTE